MSIVCIYTPVYTWMPTRLRAAPHFNARSSGVPPSRPRGRPHLYSRLPSQDSAGSGVIHEVTLDTTDNQCQSSISDMEAFASSRDFL